MFHLIFRSLLFGSDIASSYIQPNIGGDIALFKGIAKGLFQIETQHSGTLDLRIHLANHTNNFEVFRTGIHATTWETIEKNSGLDKRQQLKILQINMPALKNVVFAWAMGLTHHAAWSRQYSGSRQSCTPARNDR